MAARGKKKRYTNTIPKMQLLALCFVGTISVSLLSFISVPLGIMGMVAFSIGVMIYAERMRRGAWEKAASFKFKTLFDAQETLSSRIGLNRRDITSLQTQMQDTMDARMAANDAVREDTSIRQKTSSPRAVKPSIQSGTEHTAPINTKTDTETPAGTDPNHEADDYDFISDIVVKELLHNAIEHERVDVFVQPIVRLPQRQTRFYELFARIRAKPGLYLPAARYMQIAEQDNLGGPIDDLLLLHSLKTIHSSAHIEKAAPFFINITGKTLRNGAFMKRLLNFLSQNRHLAPRLVFEMGQRDFADVPPAVLEIIKGLGTLGCSFSLDHVEAHDFDIAKLQRYRVRFVKMHAAMLLSYNSAKEFTTLQRAKRVLEANGIGVIVERIETEEHMRGLLDFDLHYGQGYLFGKPGLQGAYKNNKRVRRSSVIDEELARG